MKGIHSVRVTVEPDFGVTYRAICSDLAADCHYICADGCESWGEVVRNEAGAVLWHTDCYGQDVKHHMSHHEECNYVSFLQEEYDLADVMKGAPFSLTIPATFAFDGSDSVTWEKADQ